MKKQHIQSLQELGLLSSSRDNAGEQTSTQPSSRNENENPISVPKTD